MIKREPGEQGYWDQILGPDMVWNPSEKRLRIGFNKKTQRIRYEGETEDYVEIVIEPKDAPDTAKLPPKP